MDPQFVLRLIAALVVVLAGGMSYRFRSAADRAGGKASRAGEGPALMVLLRLFGGLAWLGVFAFILKPEWIAWAQMPLPMALRASGAILAIAAVPLFWWVLASLGHNITDTVATRDSATLVTHGPYRYVRHPLYAVGLVLFVGMTLMSASAFIAAGTVVAVVLLTYRTGIEEAKLIARFGDDYRAYMGRTGRFVPRMG